MSRRLVLKVQALRKKHNVPKMMGPFTHGTCADPELDCIETFLHEVSHWVCGGNALEKLPTRLTKQVEVRMRTLSKASANAMELDTSLVTFLVLRELGLWDNLEIFARSCSKNLQGYTPSDEVEKSFRTLFALNADFYLSNSHKIVKWLKPSHRLPAVNKAAVFNTL